MLQFGTPGCMRRSQPKPKLAPLGAKCIMLGPSIVFQRGAPRVRDPTTGRVIVRQAINWHPPVVERQRRPMVTASLVNRGVKVETVYFNPRRNRGNSRRTGGGIPSNDSSEGELEDVFPGRSDSGSNSGESDDLQDDNFNEASGGVQTL